MPIVRLENVGELTLDQKKELVSKITQTIVEVTGKSANTVYVRIDELKGDNFGVGGELLSQSKNRT